MIDKHLGCATAEGTLRFAGRYGAAQRIQFFKSSASGITLSSIGVGTYRGGVDDAGDADWAAALRQALMGGVNVIDTARKYRQGRSERLVGQVLSELLHDGLVHRDEVFVSTKAGLLLDGEMPGREHCIDPDYVARAVAESRERLRIDTVDCLFLHNAELESVRLGHPVDFRPVFEVLEKTRQARHVVSYGFASWNGFRRRAGSKARLDLHMLLRMAEDVGGANHGLRFIEFPISIGMPWAAATADGGISTLQTAQDLGLCVFASGTCYEGKLPELLTLSRLMGLAGSADATLESRPATASLPASENSIAQLFEVLLAVRATGRSFEDLLGEATHSYMRFGVWEAAIDVVRSLPQVTSALVGMETADLAAANLRLATVPLVHSARLQSFWRKLRLPSETPNNS